MFVVNISAVVWRRAPGGVYPAFATSALTLSLLACMLRYRTRGEERMMYSCLEKELVPSLLVERLIELSRAVKNKPH